MNLRLAAMAMALSTVTLAGCLSGAGDDPNAPPATHYTEALPSGLEVSWAPGSISSITNNNDMPTSIGLPHGWLLIAGQPGSFGGMSLVDEDTLNLEPSSTTWFLPPPRDESIELRVSGETILLDPLAHAEVVPENEVVSGENVWDLSAYQEANFPHRQVNLPSGNYWTSIDYFEQYFLDLGLEVEVDPYGTEAMTNDGANCVPDDLVIPEVTSVDTRGACPGSLANVVATLPGSDPDLPTIFVAGGHFDMVPETTHAAFDDTSGVVATMELARAMSQFEWRHTLKFGLWGGEEDGILGSQFWVQTNPDAKATVTSYWNLDVVGMSWPGPLVEPDPVIIAAGLDIPSDAEGGGSGPYADPLLDFARELQTVWFGFPSHLNDTALWHYEGVVSGQANGYVPVNAQSDHTPFMAAGIPAYFIFNGDALNNPIGIHNEFDTLENMTRYSIFGTEGLLETWEEEEEFGSYDWDPAEYAQAKQALADSWEVIMWFPFYSTVLQDVGYWHAPGVAGQIEANS